MFGNLGSTFTPKTPRGKPEISKTYFAEESAKELRSITDNDKLTILNLIKGDINISPEIESPGKATELDSLKKETNPGSGNPHSPLNSKPEPEDTGQFRDPIINKWPKIRSVNSERTPPGATFKKLDKNDIYFSQNNNTTTPHHSNFPTPSWTAFDSGLNYSSMMSHFSRVSSHKNFTSFEST
jgi:hypothetical protein